MSDATAPAAAPKRVVIVGAGFGGLQAARTLKGQGLDVLLVDRHNYHLFQPLLYQVAISALEPNAIAYPIRRTLRHWRGVRFRMAQVRGVDLGQRRLQTNEGAIDYDYLILAAGSATNFFGNASVEQHAHELKNLDGAVALRNQILRAFEQAAQQSDPAARQAWLTFVVVGGGPTGVEFAGALAELVKRTLARDYDELKTDQVRVILCQAGSALLPPFPARLRRYALKRLRRLGVDVRLNTPVASADAEQVQLKDGTVIPARTLLWAAGVAAAPLAAAVAGPKARGGRIPVQPDLSLPGHPEVFVIGDMAYRERRGQPLPQLSQPAIQGGRYAARAIAHRERGERPPRPFRYFDKGTMAVIGRGSAVADVLKVPFHGVFAWLLWLGVHIFYLIGFRNRLLTMVDWGFDYLFFDSPVRLITDDGSQAEVGADSAPPASAAQQPAAAESQS